MKQLKRILSVILCAAMVLSGSAASVYAEALNADESELISYEAEADEISDKDVLLTDDEISDDDAVESDEESEYTDEETDEEERSEDDGSDAVEYENDKAGGDEAVDNEAFHESVLELSTSASDELSQSDNCLSCGYIYIPEQEAVESYSDDMGDSLLGLSSLQSKYETDDLPSLRNQYPYGSCWAHGAMATAEMSMKKQGLAVSPDYSELHLAYFTYNTPVDPLGGTDGDRNKNISSDNFLDVGGSYPIANNILTSWIGVADESLAKYENASSILRSGLDKSIAYQDKAHLRNYYKVSTEGETNRNIIKRMIMNYGAVNLDFYAIKSTVCLEDEEGNTYYKDDIYDSYFNSYYNPLKMEPNHAVTVVGWDDDFYTWRFKTQPEGKGAWLVRNSWSTGDRSNESYEGYFWLSYYDKGISDSAYGYEYDRNSNFDHNYQYDGGFYSNSMYDSSVKGYSMIRGANIFRVPYNNSKCEELEAASFCTDFNELDYQIDVYLNPDEADPASGRLVSTTCGHTTCAGYYTVTLDESVLLKPGDRFSIVVQLSKPDNYIGFQYEIDKRVANWFQTTVECDRGQSFYAKSVYSSGSPNGRKWENWIDLSTDPDHGNIRIKAFTSDSNIKPYYTVAMHANNGTDNVRYQTIYFGNRTPLYANNFTNPGYSFDGWGREPGSTFSSYDDCENIWDESSIEAFSTYDIYAVWKGNTYTVNFNPNGGSCSVASKSVIIGESYWSSDYTNLPVPTKEGYKFDGWYTSKTGGDKIENLTTVTIARNHTLYAHWTAREYYLTFDTDGGGYISGRYVTYDSEYGELPTPSKTGYDFAGWYTDPSGGTRITATSLVRTASSHDLYAHWTPHTYTITLDANGGTCSASSLRATYGNTYSGLPTPTRTGYVFAGWYTETSGGTEVWNGKSVSITSDMKLYAHWTAKTVKVSFDAMGGSCNKTSKNVTYGNTYGDLPVPTKDGCAFKGWYTSETGGTEVTGSTEVTLYTDHTLYAQWTIVVIVSFDANGGTSSFGARAAGYEDEYGNLPDATRTGYDFAGWYTARSGGSRITESSQVTKSYDHTLYAHWAPHVYTITFNANGGTLSTVSLKVTYDDTYSDLPTPTRTGYDFAGWYTDATGGSKISNGQQVSITSDTRLYAHWTGKQYKVTFNAMGGSCSKTEQYVTYGNTYGSLPQPVKEGNYAFDGWFTSETEGTKVTDSTRVNTASDHVLYARWIAVTTIVFDANGGTCSEQSKVVAIGEKYGQLPEPEREGYFFNGWTREKVPVIGLTEDDLFIEVVEKTINKNDIVTTDEPSETLYAVWTYAIYIVTFDSNGGTGQFSEEMVGYLNPYVIKGFTDYDTLPVPEREGYSFDGWFTEKNGGEKVEDATIVRKTCDHTLYAHWTINRYKVTFNAMGGTCSKTEQYVTYGNTYGSLPEPKKDNCTFEGWYTEAEGGDRITDKSDVTITAPQTLYAHWTAEKYDVWLRGNGGTFLYGHTDEWITVTYGKTYGTFPKPSCRFDYKFEGWYTEKEGGVKIDSSTVVSTKYTCLYAHWSYPMTFDPRGGTCDVTSKKVFYDEEVGELPVATRPGYVFVGWFNQYSKQCNETTRFTSDFATVYAGWKRAEYTVTLNPSGGTCSVDSIKVYYEQPYGYSGGLPCPEDRDGFIFDGWYTEATGGTRVETTSIVTATEDHTLYARWIGKQYSVTLVPGRGKIGNTVMTVTMGESYADLPVPEPPVGYDFLGWFDSNAADAKEIKATSIVDTAADHTLYAKYKGAPHTVFFNANGGALASEDASRTVYYNTAYGPMPVPEKEGYEFLGWYPSAYASEASEVTEDTTERLSVDHTLYARWKVMTFTVTVDANGGYWEDGKIRTLTREWDATLSDGDLSDKPINGWHEFDNWYDDKDCKTVHDFGTPVRSDIMLFAGWKEITDSFRIKGLNEEGYEYTGAAIKPVIEVYDCGVTPDRPLVEKTDYTLTFKDNTSIGDGNDTDSAHRPCIIIKGKGNYTSEQKVYFSIVPRKIGNGTDFADGITASVSNRQSNGKDAQVSKPTIKCGKKTLKEKKDYTLSYDGDLVNPGAVTVTVTAAEGSFYTGSARMTYYIYSKGKNISSAYVSSVADQQYSGREIALDDLPLTVGETKNGPFLTRGVDYDVRYASGADRVNVGSPKIEIYGIGDEYRGTKTVSFKIVPGLLTDGDVAVSVADAFYSGSKCTPDVTITKDGETIDPSCYTLNYGNNTGVAGSDEIRNGKSAAPFVTVKFKGCYTGTLSPKRFSIRRLPLGPDDVTVSIPDMKDSDKGISASSLSPKVTRIDPVTSKTLTMRKDTDYDIVFSRSATKLQTAHIVFKGNYENRDGCDISADFLIYSMPDDISSDSFDVLFTDEEYVYTGDPVKPSIMITGIVDGKRIPLEADRDYKVSYSNNTNAAGRNDARAPQITVKGTGAYKGSISRTFSIARKTLSEDEFSVSVTDIKCNGSQQTPKVAVYDIRTGKALPSKCYTVMASPTVHPTESATLTVTGTGNLTGTIESTFRVYEQPISGAFFEKIPSQTYTGGAVIPPSSDIRGYTDRSKKKELVEGVDYVLSCENGKKFGKSKITVTGIGRYGGSTELSYSIGPKWLTWMLF